MKITKVKFADGVVLDHTEIDLQLQHAIDTALDCKLGEKSSLYSIVNYYEEDNLGIKAFSARALSEVIERYIHDEILFGKRLNQTEYIEKVSVIHHMIENVENDVGKIANRFASALTESSKAELTYLPEVVKARKLISKLAKNANLNSKRIEEEIEKIEKYVIDWLMERPTHQVTLAIKSGIYNPLQVIKSFTIIGKQANEGIVKPYPVVGSYSTGIPTPLQYANESASAITANLYTQLFVPKTEVFAKEAQFNARNITFTDDCGTENGFTYKVDKRAIGSYVWDDGWKQTTKYNIHKYMGKEMKVRVPFTCDDLAIGHVCEKCVGLYVRQLPPSINITYVLIAMFNEKKSQKILSTKHLIASAVASMILDTLLPKGFVAVGSGIKTDREVQIVYRREDVSYIDDNDENSREERAISKNKSYNRGMDVFQLTNIRKLAVITDGELALLEMKDIAPKCAFTKDLLSLVNEEYDKLTSNNVPSKYVPELVDFFGKGMVYDVITIPADQKVIITQESTLDIRAITNEVMAILALTNPSKLRIYGVLDLTVKIDGKFYVKEEYIKEYIDIILQRFEHIGHVPLASLGMFIAMMSVNKETPTDGKLGKGLFRGYTEGLNQSISRGLGRSKKYELFGVDAHLVDSKTRDPMDDLLNSDFA